MGNPNRHYYYRCVTCDTKRSVRRKGSRIQYPCPECEHVQTFDRVGRVTAE